MEKSRIVAVLRKARGLGKGTPGKTVISARLAARNKGPRSKLQNASALVTQNAPNASASRTTANEAKRSETISRQDASREENPPTAPE